VKEVEWAEVLVERLAEKNMMKKMTDVVLYE
jgi:hypothetical protein